MNFVQASRIGVGGLRNPSWIKTICLVTLLQLLLPNDVKCAYQNLYNPDYLDELEQESQDKTSDEDFLTPSIYIHPDDDGGFHNGEKDLLEKRHLGAVTALKDRFQFQRQPMMTSEMLKRHLGSIVSLKKQNLSQMEKRYLGSVAPKSGFRPLSKLTQSERFTSKRHVGAMAKINSKPFKRDGGEGMWDTGSRGIVWNSGESSGETFDEYPVDADLGNADGFQDNPVTIKTKRFLGSLARGGWFPRQFRGFVAAENPYDKRHIGSAARMGFVPLTKSDRDGYFFGEGGFKRNVQSLKQNQFGSPSNYNWGWGRQRE